MTDRQRRDAITGQYVTAEHAETNPDTTVSEQRTRRPAVNGWQDALVVRDKVGVLWGRIGRDMWMSLDGQQVRIGTEGLATSRYSPITPADGQPIARTVGDLTPRHVGRRVSVDGFEGELVAFVALFDGIVTVEVLTVDDFSAPRRCTLDTPCEVLP